MADRHKCSRPNLCWLLCVHIKIQLFFWLMSLGLYFPWYFNWLHMRAHSNRTNNYYDWKVRKSRALLHCRCCLWHFSLFPFIYQSHIRVNWQFFAMSLWASLQFVCYSIIISCFDSDVSLSLGVFRKLICVFVCFKRLF